MITAILSFFSGSVFRMIWGEVSAWLTKRQDHAQELERLRLQDELDASAHARRLEVIKLEAEKGLQVIEAQAVAEVGRLDAATFQVGVEGVRRPSGVRWVDAWNACINPALATWSILMITGNYLGFWTLDDYGWSLTGAALGVYVANRELFKRGK